MDGREKGKSLDSIHGHTPQPEIRSLAVPAAALPLPTPKTAAHAERRPGVVAAGIALALLGATVLLAWLTRHVALIRLNDAFPPMAPSTALCFISVGLGIAAAGRARWRAARLLHAPAFVIAALMLFEHALGRSLGIDQAIAAGYLRELYPIDTAGRMVLLTAIAFLAAGAAGLIFRGPGDRRRAVGLGAAGAFLTAVGVAVTIGYLSGLRSAYHPGLITGVAPTTAAGFLVLGIAYLKIGRDRRNEFAARLDWVATFSTISCLTVVVLIWQALVVERETAMRQAVRGSATTVAAEIDEAVQGILLRLSRLGRRWERRGGTIDAEWADDARDYVADSPGYRALAWIDPSLRIRWAEPSIVDFPRLPRTTPTGAMALYRSPAIAPSLLLPHAGEGFLAIVPFSPYRRYQGLIAAAVEWQGLMDQTLERVPPGYAVVVRSGGREVYRRGAELDPRDSRYLSETSAKAGGARYQLEVWPEPATLTALKSNLPEMILTAGVLGSLLLGLALALATRARQLARDAAAANRSKSEFLGTMSHELRTPLNSVIGFANQLLKNKGGRLDPQEIIYLSRIQANGSHLLALINEILDLSKIEAGKMTLTREPIDLAALVHEATAQLEPQFRERGIALALDLPPGLRPLSADGQRMRQVVLNLVGNALKFTERGSVTVRLVADGGGRPGRLEVVDTGIGIPEDRRTAVFEAFQQADGSTQRRFGGTGLGLTISRALIEQMGYRLTLESAEGRGSTFSVVFGLAS